MRSPQGRPSTTRPHLRAIWIRVPTGIPRIRHCGQAAQQALLLGLAKHDRTRPRGQAGGHEPGRSGKVDTTGVNPSDLVLDAYKIAWVHARLLYRHTHNLTYTPDYATILLAPFRLPYRPNVQRRQDMCAALLNRLLRRGVTHR